MSDTPGELVIGFRGGRDGRKDGISNDGDVRLFRWTNVEYFSPPPTFCSINRRPDILLGVGVSGLIMNLSDGEYHVHISPTLLVSTISLFVTLTSMLIVVPLSKWRMTRTFGICLVVFFTLSTIASVIVEIVW